MSKLPSASFTTKFLTGPQGKPSIYSLRGGGTVAADNWVKIDDIIGQVRVLAGLFASDKKLTVIPILRGGAPFMHHFGRAIHRAVFDHSFIDVPIIVRRIHSDQVPSSNQEPWVDHIDGKLEIDHRNILILDDICDSGQTLSRVKSFVEKTWSPETVRTAVVLYKESDYSSFVPDFPLFTILSDVVAKHPNTFYCGFGMDFEQMFRHVEGIVGIETRTSKCGQLELKTESRRKTASSQPLTRIRK